MLFFNRSLPSILEDLPLHSSIEEALLSFEGDLGAVLKVVEAYEQADWQYVEESSFDKEMMTDCYVEAMSWADEVVGIATGI
jgi:EAL and modified HD-GYP domain-containing signal transduction protein